MAKEKPAWLDETFLATALQGGEGKDPLVTVTNMSVTPAVAVGNNYMSTLYRVKAEYIVGNQQRHGAFMVKALIKKGIVTEMANFENLAIREPTMYKGFLPTVKEKFGFDFGPKSFYCPIEYNLVMQDLKEDGYVMQDKYKQLDYPHCELVLKTLAKFHAASVSVYRDNPELIESVGGELLYVEGEWYDKSLRVWLKSIAAGVAGIVASFEDGKEMSEMLLKRADHLADSGLKLCKPRESSLNVLNHGDIWSNNVLFKHNSAGEPVEAKLIDFQITRFTSPALDLHYFIWTSADENVRRSRLFELLTSYLQTFNQTLEDIGRPERISYEELQEDMAAASDWAIITICHALPIILCEQKDVINLEEVKSEDFDRGRFMHIYSGKHFNANLPGVIKHFQAWLRQFKSEPKNFQSAL